MHPAVTPAVIPALIIVVSLLTLALCQWIATPAYQWLNLDQRKARIGHIDGLRGYLALLVFISHFALTYRWQHGADWLDPMGRLLTNFGQSAVALFFIITGFLFFGRIISKDRPMNWRRFFISRWFRIYPLYLAVVGMVFLLTFAEAGFDAHVSPIKTLKALIQWLCFTSGAINADSEAPIKIAHVEWTLRFEWAFYLLLPLLALLLQKARLLFLAVAVIAIGLSVQPVHFEVSFFKFGSQYFVLFFAGALVAWLRPLCLTRRFFHWIDEPWVGALCLVAWVVMISSFDTAYGLTQTLILTAILIPIACGNSLLGLLAFRGSIALGEVSYSIYLGHGLVLYLIYSVALPDLMTRLSFGQTLWLLPITAVLLVGSATASYLCIERPGVRVGKRLGARLFRDPDRSLPRKAQ